MSNKSLLHAVISAFIDVHWPRKRRTQGTQVKCYRKGFMEEVLELMFSFMYSCYKYLLHSLCSRHCSRYWEIVVNKTDENPLSS